MQQKLNEVLVDTKSCRVRNVYDYAHEVTRLTVTNGALSQRLRSVKMLFATLQTKYQHLALKYHEPPAKLDDAIVFDTTPIVSHQSSCCECTNLIKTLMYVMEVHFPRISEVHEAHVKELRNEITLLQLQKTGEERPSTVVSDLERALHIERNRVRASDVRLNLLQKAIKHVLCQLQPLCSRTINYEWNPTSDTADVLLLRATRRIEKDAHLISLLKDRIRQLERSP